MIKTRGKPRKPSKNAEPDLEQECERAKLVGELVELAEEPVELSEVTAGPSSDRVVTSRESHDDEELDQPVGQMVDLGTILQELREFRWENGESLRQIKDDIRKANSRIDDAEQWIVEAEERTQILGEATLELLELQRRAEDKMTDLVGRARRENV